MKRRLMMIVLFLLLGALVNVAVAWWIGSVNVGDNAPGFQAGPRSLPSSRFNQLVLSTESTPTSTRVSLFWVSDDIFSGRRQVELADFIPSWFWPYLNDAAFTELRPNPPSNNVLRLGRLVQAYGWPAFSLSGSYLLKMPTSRADAIARSEWAIPLGNYGDHPTRTRMLPLRPIWPGFAINTLFYAAILWGLFAAPVAVRRRIRIRRNLCPACAYPVGEGDRCTECGAVVRLRPPAA